MMILLKLVDKDEINKGLVEMSSKNNLEMCKILINNGADVNYCDNEKLLTPLLKAAEYDSLDVAKLLLEKGANPNLAPQSLDIFKPISIAFLNGSVNVAKLLIEREEDINKVDNTGSKLVNYISNSNSKESAC